MSLTLTKIPDSGDAWGRHRAVVFDVTFDNSYPLTNGYTINAQDVGLKYLLGAQVIGGNKAKGALIPSFDTSTTAGDLKTSLVARLFLPSGGGTAPATLTAPVGGAAGAITIGGTATATPASGATPVTSTGAQPAIPVSLASVTATQATGGAIVAGIGKEVGNTTDVSSIIVRVLFIGQ